MGVTRVRVVSTSCISLCRDETSRPQKHSFMVQDLLRQLGFITQLCSKPGLAFAVASAPQFPWRFAENRSLTLSAIVGGSPASRGCRGAKQLFSDLASKRKNCAFRGPGCWNLRVASFHEAQVVEHLCKQFLMLLSVLERLRMDLAVIDLPLRLVCWGMLRTGQRLCVKPGREIPPLSSAVFQQRLVGF